MALACVLPPPTSTSSTYSAVAVPLKCLQSCSTMEELKQCQAQIIKLGRSSDNDAMGRVIKFCALAKSGDLNRALKVFAMLPPPDAFVYNIMLIAFWEKICAEMVFFSTPVCWKGSSCRMNLKGFLGANIALEQGDRIYEYIRRSGVQVDLKLATTFRTSKRREALFSLHN